MVSLCFESSFLYEAEGCEVIWKLMVLFAIPRVLLINKIREVVFVVLSDLFCLKMREERYIFFLDCVVIVIHNEREWGN